MSKHEMPGADEKHFVLQTPLAGPFAEGMQQVLFGMGCFWGAERVFWQMEGVFTTSVGYAGGQGVAPDYEAVCSGSTGHAEVVHVVYDPKSIRFEILLKAFWEHHDPTQGDRQGNDRGSQYRSAIFTFSKVDQMQALASKAAYGPSLQAGGFGPITTQISANPGYYIAELYHQQYLAKNPDGYCGIGGTGVSCPRGAFKTPHP
ncbi:MAG: peptide-methionine (S)-S-oxide reductase MsrA [Rhodobacteraceae bacterium]|nr:peptide-methionine (S)-S-oxide reductase MsrA [Paracoccaceae bacterium]